MGTRTRRQPSEHAQAAKQIKATLTKAFPGIKFSVRSDSFAGGDSVDVHYTDGPTTDQVEKLIGQHQYGSFDGMIDLYEYTNVRDDIPQAKYVHSQRSMSQDAMRQTVDHLNRYWGWELKLIERPARTYGKHTYPAYFEVDPESDGPMPNGWGYKSQYIHRTFSQFSLICSKGHTLVVGDAYCPECGEHVNDSDRIH